MLALTARRLDADALPLLQAAATVPVAPAISRRSLERAGARVSAPALREAVLVVRLRRGLGDEALHIGAAVVDGDALPDLRFAPYSDAGSTLPLLRPSTADTGIGAAVRLDLRCWRLRGERAATGAEPIDAELVDAADWDGLFVVEAVEGVLARILLLSQMGSQRAQTALRSVAAMRHVDLARRSALDALGRDHGVPRQDGEDDASYRARLALFTSWRVGTPRGFDQALNGPGAVAADNAGLPAGLGVRARFRMDDEPAPWSLALLPVAVGPEGPARLQRFQQLLRARYLL
ncbi:MAG: hypothetical protein ACOCXJ_02500, partial [Planctomycetota bacterium]